jgi:hypothetical protein
VSRSIDGLYTEQEEAERLGVKLRTLRAWRAMGYGPAPTRIGRFVYYSPKAESEFIAAGEQPFPKRAGSTSRIRAVANGRRR